MPLPRRGATAPKFALEDQFGRAWRMEDALRRGHGVLLLFYPLDWTPICSTEVPELNARRKDFLRDAGVEVVALSADSRHSHAQWCRSHGGVQIPVLSDFWPHGVVAKRYGLLDEATGIPARATVLVGPDGRVLWAEDVGRDNRRKLDDIFRLARKALRNVPETAPVPPLPALPTDVDVNPAGAVDVPATERGAGYTLYADRMCGHCRAVLATLANLGVRAVRAVYSGDHRDFRQQLQAATGQPGVPALVLPSGQVLVGDRAINAHLLETFGATE